MGKSRGRVPRRTICTAATSASHHLAPPTITMTESLVAVRVELPTYSLSFSIQVDICATVLDVKHAISASCTGQPRVEGQRIIWRGRYLEDQEKISDIWKVTKNLRLLRIASDPSFRRQMSNAPSIYQCTRLVGLVLPRLLVQRQQQTRSLYPTKGNPPYCKETLLPTLPWRFPWCNHILSHIYPWTTNSLRISIRLLCRSSLEGSLSTHNIQGFHLAQLHWRTLRRRDSFGLQS